MKIGQYLAKDVDKVR